MSDKHWAAFWLVILAAVLFGVSSCAAYGCVPDYGEGSRVGFVRKISKKGLIFKSWEGEMVLRSSSPGEFSAEVEKWAFTVDSDEVAAELGKVMESGKRIKAHYTQWLFPPIKGDTDYRVKRIEVEK